MSKTLDNKILEWLSWDKNESTRSTIQNLKDEGDTNQLKELLLSRLKFGTAGLRGKMGAGYSQMNDLVIIQTSQGLSIYVEESFGETAKNAGIIIGYDGRHNSRRFAELTATVFLLRGIPVYLYSKVCPTPFVAYAVTHLKCVCGIMVTASHNPKEDNGYKVYWDNGCQIISPHDKNIQNTILEELAPWEKSWDTSIVHESPLCKDPLEEVENAYYCTISENTSFPELNRDAKTLFTYTAMHGVGYPYMLKAFEAAQLKPFVIVEEQKDPDPEFPTVKFPNPEEGKSALNLSFQAADENCSSLILANDPDADRLAVAEKKENGEWHVFTGNEVGALLGWWTFHCHQQKNLDTPTEDLYMMSSTVSSKILQNMARVEGFSFMETLTGFKWMGNATVDLMKKGKTILFAFEEAIGFMCGTAVLDKDGISAGIQVAEMVTYLEKDNMTLLKKLETIYVKYGQHITLNSYYLCSDIETIKCIFEKLCRPCKGKPNSYPDKLMDGKYEIVAVRDLREGYDSNEPDFTPKLPTSSSGYMVTFTFSNGVVATLRTSGTEPKIKYYTELCSSPGEQNVTELQKVLQEMVQALVNEFLEPELNGLIPRSG